MKKESIKHENEELIQRKNLLNIKMVVSYLNFVFFIEEKAILNSEFRFSIYQKNERALWVHGLM